MSLNLLDCTLRDGGYYNNWEFNDKLVNSYVSKLRKSKIDVIEIGFRFFLIILAANMVRRKKI